MGSIREYVEQQVRKYYAIPEDADNLSIEESLETEYGCCGHDGYSFMETHIKYRHKPEGRKRHQAIERFYRGSIFELLEEIERSSQEL